MKEYVVCAENINGKEHYTIRVSKDCSPLRFKVIADFSTYLEAQAFIDLMQN